MKLLYSTGGLAMPNYRHNSYFQMTPGPIAINSATYVGYSVADFGEPERTLAACLPVLTVMAFITRFYLKLRHNPYVERIMQL